MIIGLTNLTHHRPWNAFHLPTGKKVILTYQQSIQKVSERLLKKEVIFKEDQESILGKRPDEKMSSGETQKKITPAACKLRSNQLTTIITLYYRRHIISRCSMII